MVEAKLQNMMGFTAVYMFWLCVKFWIPPDQNIKRKTENETSFIQAEILTIIIPRYFSWARNLT